MTDQPRSLNGAVTPRDLEAEGDRTESWVTCEAARQWTLANERIAALERQLAECTDECNRNGLALVEALRENEEQEITLDAVADLCGEALGTAREYRSPIGCASALANYIKQSRDDNAAMREALKPFARLAEFYPDTTDSGPVGVQTGRNTPPIMVTGHDCHVARKAAGEKP